MLKPIITLKDIAVSFDGEQVLKNFNLTIGDGEFVTLLGPSGCGKTTVLRTIGGFVTPDSGDVFFGDEKINNVPPHKRAVNTIFQKYALFPHLNVYENIAFGMRLKGKKEDEIQKTVTEMLHMVNLNGMAHRGVGQLSGGQQQRVAIARALANEPKVLLLDEPLSALDLKLRKDMQNELKKIQQAIGITFIFVTHDQEEALSMSDTVVVMDKGEIQQIGSPIDIYNEPKNAFVADFIGESNILDGTMIEDYLVEVAGQRFKSLDSGFGKMAPVDVVIRPEDIDIVPTGSAAAHINGVVTSVTFKGVHYEIIVDVDGFKWMIQTTDSANVGDKIGLANMRSKLISAPYTIWMMLFIIVPMGLVAFFAFTDKSGAFTLDNIARVGQYSNVFLRSIWLGALATFISLLLGYPLAYTIAKAAPNRQSFLILLIMLPMWMNFLLRTYAWMSLLEDNGLINNMLAAVGLPRIHMINTAGAVVLGMVYNYIPYMILPIYSVLTKIDNSVIEAAQDLGANNRNVFLKVVLPMSMPGVISGVTMVFVPAVSTFIISKMLGGGGNLLIGDLIDMQFLGSAYNPNLGSAISLVLMVIILICMGIMNQFDDGENVGGGMIL